MIDRLAREIHLGNDETAIEIGPGLGAVTRLMLERAGRVIAIEFDRNLIPILQEKFGAHDNFTLIQRDALLVDFCELMQPAREAKIVANLPYNIATAIVRRFVEQRRCLPEITLVLQKEVVDRLTAPPNSKERGFISVLLQAYYDAERLFHIGPHSFRPAPKVWSSAMRLTRKAEVSATLEDESLLTQLLSAAFAQRRKTMLNNLRQAPSPLRDLIQKHGGVSIVLCQAEVPLEKRAEMLTLEEWIRILEVLKPRT